MAGNILFSLRGFIELTGRGTSSALGAEAGKGVQGKMVVAVSKNGREGLQEPSGFVGSLQAFLLHVVAVFLCGCHRSVLRHPFHWIEILPAVPGEFGTGFQLAPDVEGEKFVNDS